MEQKILDKKKVISTNCGFPLLRKMFLGAHMINDYCWPLDKKDKEQKYNVAFNPDLGVVALRDISVGEELFADYHLDSSIHS